MRRLELRLECHIEEGPWYLQNGKHAEGLETMQETGRPEAEFEGLLEHLKSFHGKITQSTLECLTATKPNITENPRKPVVDFCSNTARQKP